MINLKNFLLISSILTIASIVGIYIPYVKYQKQQENNSVPQNMGNTSVAVITYTNKGFNPNYITVRTGSQVEWINTSDKLMWVASDPHPSHTDLPGFDEKGIEGNNVDISLQIFASKAYAHTGQKEYRYTFLKPGVWKYHNHLNPADRGTIVVE